MSKIKTDLLIIVAILVVGGYFMLGGGSSSGINGNVVSANGEIQEVVLGMKNYNYYPEKVSVGAGNTVRLSMDDSAYGCFRDFTLREFGVRKYLATPSDYVEFVADKKGTYTFSCSMGMGIGTLVVE